MLLAVSVPNYLSAQTSTATILGTVTDSSGAVVPGVAVTVTNTGTGIAQVVTSDTQGRYTVPSLPIGTYSVQAAMTGFKKVIHSGIVLTVGSQTVVDLSLAVGQVEQVVEVQGNVVQVDTTSSTVSNLVGTKQMLELPLNGRDFSQLLTLAPGVQQAQNVGMLTAGRGATYSVAGQRPSDQQYLLDDTYVMGFNNHGTGSEILGTTLGVDAIAEFQMLYNSYSAQFGGNGAVINAVTKSGTNELHGSAFEFLRNSALDARNFFDRTPTSVPDVFTPTPVPEFRRNQFGGTLGGPIKKDKLFFFANYEGLRAAQGTTETSFVPDANALQGNLACGPVNSTYAIQPCPDDDTTGTLINVLNPAIKSLVALYPTTTAVASDGSGAVPLSVVGTAVSHENYFLGRIDAAISSKDTLFGRFVADRSFYDQPIPFSSLPFWPETDSGQNTYFTTEERHSFAKVVNSIRETFVRDTINANVLVAGQPGFDTALQFFQDGRAPATMGAATITGLAALGPNIGTPSYQLQNKWGVGDDLIWTKGAHTVKVGADFQRLLTQSAVFFGQGGWYWFNSLQDLLTATPSLFIGAPITNDNPWGTLTTNRFSPYVNDDWKISSKLSVNLGVRYDWESNPACLSKNCWNLLNPSTDTNYTSVNNGFLNNPSVRNFGPRVGFAYAPFNDRKTSIRGGFALFRDLITPTLVVNSFTEMKTMETVALPAPPYPNPFGGGVSTASPSIGWMLPYRTDRTPYDMEWDLNIQRELGGKAVLEVGYVGSRSDHLLIDQDINPPTLVDGEFGYVSGGMVVSNTRINPNFGYMDADVPSGNASYNSLQVNVSRQFSRSLAFQANYTFSKCIDIEDSLTNIYGDGLPSTNSYNPSFDRGLCGYNQTHTFHANAVYALPFGGNQFVKGWQTSAIVTANDGQPFTPYVGFDNSGVNNGASYPTDRPNMASGFTCNQSLVTGNPNDWFNTAAFTLPAPATLGDAPRNCMRGPGLFEADFSASKETNIGERVRAQFRAEFFNIFNNTNFVMRPGTQPGSSDAAWSEIFTGSGAVSPAAGVLTTTQTSSRQIQFGLKILF
jgi:hypothetical protein